MAEAQCSHVHRVRSIVHCDLSRTSGESALYTAQLTLGICSSCGQVEIYCDSYQSVCGWLTSVKANGKEKAEAAVFRDG